LDAVGLTPRAIEHAPRLKAIARAGFLSSLDTVFPAVTCSAQASFLTGRYPISHGIVANGWYFRRLDEVLFWRQSRFLIDGDTVLDELARAGKRAANLFGWFNWNCGAEISVTPKPSYPADGRKIPGIHTEPAELRASLERDLGEFPLFDFWGPRAGIRSTEWIANCAKRIIESDKPDLVFAYLPHLDYDHQRYGPDDPRSLAAIGELDRVAGDLCDFAAERGYDILGFSEYGLTEVRRPIYLNRILRRAGFLRVREDPHVGELPLFGTSRAFAVCDHQAAHIYVGNAADLPAVKELLEATDGVDGVLDRKSKRDLGVDHQNSGDLIAVSEPDCWFAYNYWLDDALAPDFARTVDIHRKPGYDPAELFLDPGLSFPKARVAAALLKKKLGFRYLLRVIPLDPSLVRGSHGRLPDDPDRGPVVFGSKGTHALEHASITHLRESIVNHLVGARLRQ
jgi:predicted AlkP superfamily pyrophosphatase or phosphodiesterase